MKFFYRTILSILLFSFTNNLTAQVNNWKFRLLLSTIISKDVPVISITEANNGFDKYLFLDSREEVEFSVSHIKNARFVGAKNFSISALNNIKRDRPIIVYCSIGKRSQNVSEKLLANGFTNVKNLYGGIFEWVNHGYPVFGTDGKETQRVHQFSKFWGGFLEKGVKISL